MKKNKKASRGRKFDEGARVRSIKPQDDKSVGTITGTSKKRDGWHYTVMFDGWYKLATRKESELEAL